MEPVNLHNIQTDYLDIPEFRNAGIEADMLRLDRIHPQISGNKWFKIRFYLEEFRRLKKSRIITRGGAWSNHLLATAAACNGEKIPCTGIVRGEQAATLSPMLRESMSLGMSLEFISRTEYKQETLPDSLDHPENYFIPSGGYGPLGAAGAATIREYFEASRNYTHVFCATGTGTMLAGLIKGAEKNEQVTGISVFKNNHSLEEETGKLIPGYDKPQIIHDYAFGGYARVEASLIRFMNDWFTQTGIPTDIVYTGKLCFAVADLAKKNFFPTGSRLLIIHSGGLSGNASLGKGTLIF